ncbi:MAG: aminotransferase class V-fold PLP-dependent enzyme, partial [Pyrinomonadaceae bacterium]
MPTPQFGRHLLSEFLLDSEVTYLNHGTVGVAPKRVLAVQQGLRDEMERMPSRFILREYSGLSGTSTLTRSRIRTAADVGASFVGARGEEIVFVENAT